MTTRDQPLAPILAPKPRPTRREALRMGSRFYRGRPCAIHGEADRYTTSSVCKECAIASALDTRRRERALMSEEQDMDDF
jgi:hypothetical protein